MGAVQEKLPEKQNFIYWDKNVFRYPIGTLFSRQHAQHTDIMHTMHTMHKGGVKSDGLEYVINLDS